MINIADAITRLESIEEYQKNLVDSIESQWMGENRYLDSSINTFLRVRKADIDKFEPKPLGDNNNFENIEETKIRLHEKETDLKVQLARQIEKERKVLDLMAENKGSESAFDLVLDAQVKGLITFRNHTHYMELANTHVERTVADINTQLNHLKINLHIQSNRFLHSIYITYDGKVFRQANLDLKAPAPFRLGLPTRIDVSENFNLDGLDEQIRYLSDDFVSLHEKFDNVNDDVEKVESKKFITKRKKSELINSIRFVQTDILTSMKNKTECLESMLNNAHPLRDAELTNKTRESILSDFETVSKLLKEQLNTELTFVV